MSIAWERRFFARHTAGNTEKAPSLRAIPRLRHTSGFEAPKKYAVLESPTGVAGRCVSGAAALWRNTPFILLENRPCGFCRFPWSNSPGSHDQKTAWTVELLL